MAKHHSMREFVSRVKALVQTSGKFDVLLEVVDARDINGTRNRDLEMIAVSKKNKIILVVNKSDLVVDKNTLNLDKIQFETILISCKKRKGWDKLIEAIKRSNKPKIKVLIIGYPDVGKSSLINWLAGKKKVKVNFTAGSTKGPQFIRVDEQIMLIDTPGIISRPTPENALALKLTKPVEKLKDPEQLAYKIIKQALNLSELYKIEIETKNPHIILEIIAKRRGLLLKGGELDLFGTAKIIIRDYQKGKLKTRL